MSLSETVMVLYGIFLVFMLWAMVGMFSGVEAKRHWTVREEWEARTWWGKFKFGLVCGAFLILEKIFSILETAAKRISEATPPTYRDSDREADQ